MKTTNRLISLFAAILTTTTMLAGVVYEPLVVDSGFNRDVIRALSGDTAISALYKTGSTSCFGTQSFIAYCNKAWETSQPANYERTVRSGWPDDYRDTIRCTEDGDVTNNPLYKDVFWLLNPYNIKNALCIRPIEKTGEIKGFQNDGTLKFKKIGSYQRLFFLLVSLREGSVKPRVVTTTIYYTDGNSTSTTFTLTGGLSGENGHRVRFTNVYETTFNKNKVGETTTAFAMVFDIEVDQTKLIDRIHFSNPIENSSVTILAVTGVTANIDAPDENTNETSAIAENSFEASWDAVDGAASYSLDVATDENFQNMVGDYNNLNVGNTTSQEVSGLTADYDYYWRIRSVNNEGGQSASSAPIRVKTAGGSVFPQAGETDDDIAGELELYLNAAYPTFKIDRTLWRDGYYNTLCLPFNMSAEEIDASPLNGATVYEYVSAEKIGETQLNIEVRATDHITAGVPYLIQWPNMGDIIPAPLEFHNVTIRTKEGQAVGDEDKVRFIGNIGIATLVEEDANNLFLGANNILYWPNKNQNRMKGFRAYFQVPAEIKEAVDPQAPARIIVQQNTPTDIERTQYSEVSVQKLLRDGQIVIVRDGKMYSILGQDIE